MARRKTISGRNAKSHVVAKRKLPRADGLEPGDYIQMKTGIVRVLKTEAKLASFDVQVIPATMDAKVTENGAIPGSRWLSFFPQEGISYIKRVEAENLMRAS